MQERILVDQKRREKQEAEDRRQRRRAAEVANEEERRLAAEEMKLAEQWEKGGNWNSERSEGRNGRAGGEKLKK